MPPKFKASNKPKIRSPHRHRASNELRFYYHTTDAGHGVAVNKFVVTGRQGGQAKAFSCTAQVNPGGGAVNLKLLRLVRAGNRWLAIFDTTRDDQNHAVNLPVNASTAVTITATADSLSDTLNAHLRADTRDVHSPSIDYPATDPDTYCNEDFVAYGVVTQAPVQVWATANGDPDDLYQDENFWCAVWYLMEEIDATDTIHAADASVGGDARIDFHLDPNLC